MAKHEINEEFIMEIYTEVSYYEHEEQNSKEIINFLLKTGWELHRTDKNTDLITGGFGSGAWQEECNVVTKIFKIYKGI